MAKEQDITVYVGEDITLEFTEDSSSGDISAWSIIFTMRDGFVTGTPTLQVSGVITNGPNGVYQIILTSANMNLTAKQYYYDVVRTNVGNVTELSVGNFFIVSGVRLV